MHFLREETFFNNMWNALVLSMILDSVEEEPSLNISYVSSYPTP